jgi:hypothetical protein
MKGNMFRCVFVIIFLSSSKVIPTSPWVRNMQSREFSQCLSPSTPFPNASYKQMIIIFQTGLTYRTQCRINLIWMPTMQMNAIEGSRRDEAFTMAIWYYVGSRLSRSYSTVSFL